MLAAGKGAAIAVWEEGGNGKTSIVALPIEISMR
jgi:hypothetical protein